MRLTGRVLPILQLTRMALVFTAIADSLCGLVIQSRARDLPIQPSHLAAVVLISIGLYGLGMSLNDIIDRRRDSLIASHRPLPSGRIGVGTAHFIAAFLTALGLGAAYFYSVHTPGGWRSLVLAFWVTALITFYDFAGKYLVAPGLLTLGLIRFFHAAIPAPTLPMVWHPLLLLNHVTLLSTVCYVWEQKRPALTSRQAWFVVASLGVIDVLVVTALYLRRSGPGESFGDTMWLTPGLVLPALAVVAFLLIGVMIKKNNADPHAAGQKLMLYGLLWLIVYDSAFAAVVGAYSEAVCIFLLLPVAYLAVRLMRAASRLSGITHRPQFRRA